MKVGVVFMPKERLKVSKVKTLADVFSEFIVCRKAKGVSAVTIKTYNQRIGKLYKYIAPDTLIDRLTQTDINGVVAQLIDDTSMNDVTVQSYTRAWKSIFRFAKQSGYCDIAVEETKAQEVAKVTYTDEEIKILLKKPNINKCTFCEYRNWVIINLLLNCGARAGTIREMKISDIDFDNHLIYCRHTKNKRALSLPLCSQMIAVLNEYLKVRNQYGGDILFPDEFGNQQTKDGLSQAIQKYNRARGVTKTSTHLFRHTFAQRYIQNGGNPFILQRILGHKDIRMTLHYCNLYGNDTVRDFDNFSPLETFTTKRITMKK